MNARTTAAILMTLLCLNVRLPAQDTAQAPGVFELARIQQEYMRLSMQVENLHRQQAYARAETVCRQLIDLVPHDPASHYNLACVLALQGKRSEAIDALKAAVTKGFADTAKIRGDPDLETLRTDPRFQAILLMAAKLKPPEDPWKHDVAPRPIEDGVAWVGESNTVWDVRIGLFRTFFEFPAPADDGREVALKQGKAGELLRGWLADGSAADNWGDLYDNQDSDHSNMDYNDFPHLARTEFEESVRSRGLASGLQLRFLYNAVTIGNSSMALTDGVFWRSQARHALVNQRSAGLLYLQYRSNHLYVYPEHRDYDPAGADGKGRGDVFPANTPYMLVSHGSSRSDHAFLNALAATLAAFRPDTKALLKEQGMLMPALQMILRSSLKPVRKSGGYLTGPAHTPVFKGPQLDPERMVRMAHDMKPDKVPPLVELKVVEETPADPSVDYFDAGQREVLFDTPCAIARVHRTTAYARRMVISAEGSRDLNQRRLAYHWVVLSGDADRIRITPRNAERSVVELTVPHHEARPAYPGADIASCRVDIGVFAHNGAYYSAPAFVTTYFLQNEKRTYDAQHRIVEVDYGDPDVSTRYVDPMLDLPKRWRDNYRYDEAGNLLGWSRTQDGVTQDFAWNGARVIERDERGRPLKARTVRYAAERPDERKAAVLKQADGDEIVRFAYASADDMRGREAGREPAPAGDSARVSIR